MHPHNSTQLSSAVTCCSCCNRCETGVKVMVVVVVVVYALSHNRTLENCLAKLSHFFFFKTPYLVKPGDVEVHFGGCSNLSCSKDLTAVIRGRREFFTFCLLPFICLLNHKDLSPIKKVSDSWLSLFSKPLKEERCVERKSYVTLLRNFVQLK